jgi:TPR repeat protein
MQGVFRAFLGIAVAAGIQLACSIQAPADASLETRAQGGDVTAQTQLGLHYVAGDGGYDKDYNQAAYWLKKASDQGNARAMTNLGLLYWDGNGVPQDLSITRALFEKAAKLGYAAADNDLGIMDSDEHTPEGDAAAVVLYQKAIGLGYKWAYNGLAIMYEEGRGVPEDAAKAEKYYEVAWAAGAKGAAPNLCALMLREQRYTQAISWCAKTPDKPVPDYNMAWMYAFGKGTPQNYAAARVWYGRCAQLGKINCAYAIGRLYEMGLGGPKDLSTAMGWFNTAVRGGDPSAMFEEASLYVQGGVVPQDFPAAHKLFLAAAIQGHYAAKVNLGTLYEHGLGVDADLVTAQAWYTLALMQGRTPEALASWQRIDKRLTDAERERVKALAQQLLAQYGPALFNSIE